MAGLYLHIPFCRQACSYCNFHFSTNLSRKKQMIAALGTELTQRAGDWNCRNFESVYLGGGTPSILNSEDLDLLLSAVFKNYSVSPGAEITIEANPDDINHEKLSHWHTVGINRLSIGIQSFWERDLKFMNRSHNVTQSIEALEAVKKYPFVISIDLIYGSPTTTMKVWQRNLQKVLEYDVEHISAYALTVEEKTALAYQIKKNLIELPDDEESLKQMNFLFRYLENNGYEHYEISNFAKSGYRAKHNALYWKGIPYLGIGPSAHSFDGKTRSWNVSNNNLYLRGRENFEEKEKLSFRDRMNEKIMTALRLKEGLDIKRWKRQSGYSLKKKFSDHINSRHVLINEDRIRLSREGKAFADAIASSAFC